MSDEQARDVQQDELRGARFQPEHERNAGGDDLGVSSFRRPFPWILAALVVALLGGLVAYGSHSRRQARLALRAQIARDHASLIAGRSVPIRTFRRNVETMLARAGTMVSPDVHEPGFRIDSLRGKSGVYVRLRERETQSPEAIERALTVMEPDVIPHCLSITPTAMRTVYTRFAPMTGEWLRSRRDAEDDLSLRVAVDEVQRYAARDLPALESIAASEYLVATIIRGEDRATDEVDFFVFDLRSGRLRLATNTKANGRLLTTRVAGYRAPPPETAALARSGAIDCSIAAQARTRTGEFGAATATAAPAPSATAPAPSEAVPAAAPTPETAAPAAPAAVPGSAQ